MTNTALCPCLRIANGGGAVWTTSGSQCVLCGRDWYAGYPVPLYNRIHQVSAELAAVYVLGGMGAVKALVMTRPWSWPRLAWRLWWANVD